MLCSIALWKFAKGAQINFGAIAKDNRSPFLALSTWNRRIACKADQISKIPLGEHILE
jgi:hypothetical protein